MLRKALRIFEALQDSPFGLSLDEVSKQTGINKSTAYRLLTHLESESYLVRNSEGHYSIGTKVVQLAAHVNPERILREMAQPFLRDLLKATRETVNLGVLDGVNVLYVEVLESPYDFRLVSKVGMRRPLYATALGKALAAFLPADEFNQILREMEFRLLTPQTISTLGQLQSELESVRRQRYAVDNEETVLGARCVAAPILNARQESIAAVSVAGPITRISRDHIPSFAAAVIQAAEAISARMGFLAARPREPQVVSTIR